MHSISISISVPISLSVDLSIDSTAPSSETPSCADLPTPLHYTPVFHAGLLRKAMEGTRKVEDAARRRTECEDCVPEPSSTYQAVAIWEIEEMYSLVGGLCALGTEAPVAATSE